jgi:23S rRNA (uracil1939-C5)-methyltransferase
LQLTIEKMVYGGDGLARLPADEHGRGKAAFLPFVLSGEKVEVTIVEEKPGFARARMESVLETSPQRLEPRCRYFQKCGGCHYQQAGYEHQLEIKASILKENLRRIAKLELETELVAHASPPWNYRNRTRLKVRAAPEFALGYYKFNSHELLPVEECPISSPLINRAIAAFWKAGRAGSIASGIQEIEFFANAEDSQLLVEIYCSPEVAEAAELVEAVRNFLPEAVGVIAFTNVAGSVEARRIALSGVVDLKYKTYRVSAGAFFQVNRHLTDELLSVVTSSQSGKTALDLYAGGGLFSVPLARSFAQVIAVESSQTSHSDLTYNSPANVKPVRMQVEQYLQTQTRGLRPDLVVVDPPRGGLGEKVVRALVALQAPRLTYVSCDPSTLARDLAGLLKAGYRVDQAHLVDLFPQTYHLESVLHLVR